MSLSTIYKLNSKKSLCKSKTATKCKRIKGCKFTNGKTRKMCRKNKNKSYKNK